MGGKSIVFFTVGYPYGKGDEFLDPEMKCAESRFEKILIVSCSKKTSAIIQYMPHNASLISIRDNVSSRQLASLHISSLFSFRTWKQIFYCIRERGIGRLLEGTRSIILETSSIKLLKKNEKKWAGKYDYYYSYWLSSSASYLAMRKNALGGITLSRAHGYDCFFDRGFHPFRAEQFSNLDYIFPISIAGKEDLIAQGCDRGKIHVARLGVEKPNDTMNPYKKAEIRTLLTCSNIVNLKRLDILIDALSLINDIKIHWIHFGDGVLREDITNMASKQLSNKSNVTYQFMGNVPVQQLYQFYSETSIDCLVNCSDAEGIPVSIMEAMSYGIPCIARDVGGNKEIISNNVNGFLLAETCTSQQLAEAIQQLLTMQNDKYYRMREEAYKQYCKEFNASNNYMRFWDTIL